MIVHYQYIPVQYIEIKEMLLWYPGFYIVWAFMRRWDKNNGKNIGLWNYRAQSGQSTPITST